MYANDIDGFEMKKFESEKNGKTGKNLYGSSSSSSSLRRAEKRRKKTKKCHTINVIWGTSKWKEEEERKLYIFHKTAQNFLRLPFHSTPLHSLVNVSFFLVRKIKCGKVV